MLVPSRDAYIWRGTVEYTSTPGATISTSGSSTRDAAPAKKRATRSQLSTAPTAMIDAALAGWPTVRAAELPAAAMTRQPASSARRPADSNSADGSCETLIDIEMT
jgi:hypothetical protein